MTGPIAEPRRRIELGAFLLLSAAVLVPIAAARLPPILDYPNHLARMYILAALPTSAPLAQYYVAHWSALPNLALDALVPPLAHAMPVETAMRLALAAILVGTAAGCAALHRVAFERRSLWPLVAFLFLYNRMLLWGFLNYLAGVAIMLWALAAWVALEARPTGWRVAVGTLAATAIYFAHLAAFGCYALALLAYASSPAANGAWSGWWRRAFPAAATLMPGAILFFLSPTSGASAGIAYGNPLRKLDLPVSIFDNYDRAFDGATFGIAALAVTLGLVSGWIRLHPRLRWSLLALVVAYLVIPSRLFSASGLDHRLPVAIAFLFAGSADWGRIESRARSGALAFMLALFAVRMTIVTGTWISANRTYAALEPALDLVPRGGRLAIAAPSEAVRAGGMPLLHFPTLAVLRRDAFVPTLFADPAQQPIHFSADAARLADEAPAAGLWQDASAGRIPPLSGYDDLAIVDPPASLDAASLPGPILFRSPRLIMVGLHEPK